MNRYQISTPEGTRDLLFGPARRLRAVEQRVRQALESRGYSEVITPAVEYYDVFAQANSALDQENIIRIGDHIFQVQPAGLHSGIVGDHGIRNFGVRDNDLFVVKGAQSGKKHFDAFHSAFHAV